MTDGGATFSIHGRDIATRDPDSVVAGLVTAIGLHVVVLLFAFFPGICVVKHWVHLGRGCVVGASARPTEDLTHPPDEEIIEGALLRQGGGGEFDPRHAVHRVVPIRAEERAHAENGLAKNHNPIPPSDAGPRRDPTALVTERDILGQGNQDLAERLQRLAQSENESAPAAPPGLGSPDGSVNGTETDPNRAGHGAQAKIRSFVQRNLHLLATAPASAHRTFRLRIIIASDGNSVARGQIVQGSGDETTDSDLAVQLAQLAENQTSIPELTDEEKAAIAGRSYIIVYDPR